MFTFDSALLVKAIRTLAKLAPSPRNDVVFRVSKGRLRLVSAGDLSSGIVLVPCKVENAEGVSFAVPVDAIQAAVKGHKTVTMSYKDGTLTVASGKFSLAMSTLDVIEPETAPPPADEWELDAGQVDALIEAIKRVALKASPVQLTWIPIVIHLGQKRGFVSCYGGDARITAVASDELTGKLDITLPLDVLLTTLDCFRNMTCRLSMDGNSLFIRSNTQRFQLALPELSDGLRTHNELQTVIAKSVTGNTLAITVDRESLVQFIENSKAIATKTRPELQWRVTGGKAPVLHVLIASPTGKATQDIPVPKLANTAVSQWQHAKKIFVDCEYLLEALSRSNEPEVTLRIVDNAMLAIGKWDDGFVSILALNQEHNDGDQSAD